MSPWMLQELTLQLALPPELSHGDTCFAMGGWWSFVFWTLLGSAWITHLPEIMGLASRIPETLGFSRGCWCCSLAFSMSAIASCGVSQLLKRAPVRSCLCSCLVPFHRTSSSKPVHWVWSLSEYCRTGKKESPSALQRGSVKRRLCD